MARLNWDAIGERVYESGVDRGVFYPSVGPGLAWNGLVSVTEAPSGGDFEKRYFDGMPYRKPIGVGEFSVEVEAYTYPDILEEYEGWSGLNTPDRKNFGLSYRTHQSNDLQEQSYQIHILYNATALPSNKSYDTLDDDAEPTPFVWDISTKPVAVPGFAPASHVVIDTLTAHSWTVSAIEDVLYGNLEAEPRLPSISELIELFDVNSLIRIVDNGDGSWTATGPDEFVYMTDATSFEIVSPNVTYLSENTFVISSF